MKKLKKKTVTFYSSPLAAFSVTLSLSLFFALFLSLTLPPSLSLSGTPRQHLKRVHVCHLHCSTPAESLDTSHLHPRRTMSYVTAFNRIVAAPDTLKQFCSPRTALTDNVQIFA